ncbi:MAG: class I SAM-dependent methyltransferase [Dehalococcoidia bacterium]
MNGTVIITNGHAPARRRPRTSYWERLREPRAIIARDIALARRVRPTRPLLDVGCGDGAFVRACRRAGIDAVGIDAFEGAALVASARGTDVLRGAGEELPVAGGSLDVVRLKEVLEHVQQPLALASEMRRVLRPGGVLIAYVPTQWSQLYPFPANFYDDYTHVRAFSRQGLLRLFEDAGFARSDIRGWTPPLKRWHEPVAAVLSVAFPFLWRAVAVKGGDHA